MDKVQTAVSRILKQLATPSRFEAVVDRHLKPLTPTEKRQAEQLLRASLVQICKSGGRGQC